MIRTRTVQPLGTHRHATARGRAYIDTCRTSLLAPSPVALTLALRPPAENLSDIAAGQFQMGRPRNMHVAPMKEDIDHFNEHPYQHAGTDDQ